MSVDPLPILLVAALICVVWAVFSCDRQSRKTLAAADRWRDRSTMDDDDFLAGCEIPDEPLRVEVALAARRVIAELGTVPAQTILPDDSFARDLVQLPFWDSLDWIGFIIEIEQILGDKVVLPEFSLIEDAIKLAGGRHQDLRVKHLVRATALAATYPPKPALFDEEL